MSLWNGDTIRPYDHKHDSALSLDSSVLVSAITALSGVSALSTFRQGEHHNIRWSICGPLQSCASPRHCLNSQLKSKEDHYPGCMSCSERTLAATAARSCRRFAT